MHMQESKIYLNFFKTNSPILLATSVLGFCVGGYLGLHQPVIYSSSDLLIMDYNDNNIQDRVTLSDQAVSVIRSTQIQSRLSLYPGSKLAIYKVAPLAINITL